MEWVIVAVFGGLVGIGELIDRYRKAPVRYLWNVPAVFYVLLNAAASLAALGLIQTFDWKFGGSTEGAIRWTRVLVAGFGAMALFRTSLFTVRAGGQDIGVGPVAFLQVFLAAADHSLDRRQTRTRAMKASELMKGVEYAKAYQVLPPYCLGVIRDVPAEQQAELAKLLAVIDQADFEDSVKVRLLGIELANVVGEDVLKDAVDSLKDEISSPPGSPR